MKKILPVLAFVLVLIFLYAPLRVSGEQKVSISGKFIRNSASGLPLNDIQVKVTGTKELIIRTDRSGNYIAYNLPAGGNYTVTPFKAGFLFAPESKTYTNLTASKINENFGVSERTYSISGKVIVGGKPSKGEIIMINTRAVKYFTNEDGEYFIDNLSYEGPYTVTVESNRVVFEPFKIDQLDKNVVYNFEKSIKAMGYVTSSGKGIAGVEIAVNNKRYKTDENGYYEINGLAANGSYILAVINSEMNPVPKFVELKKVTQDIDNVNFSLSGSISGTVKMSNKPFAGALIKVESSDQTEETKTDKNGAYKINKLGLHRDYAISVSSPGYMFSPKDRTVKKLANQTGGQNFTASVQKYKIYGVVTRGTAFVKDAEISIGGISKVVKTDAQGAYSFDGLTAGKNYSVSVKSKQIKFTESKKTVNGISGDTEINFDGLLSISGKVTIDGMPLENAKVLYDFNSFVLTDKNGNYTVDGLMPNQVYTIEVSSNDYKFTPSIFTSERLKECLTDEDFKVVIDYKLKEKEEKLAREEAAKKAKEEERLRKEELKRIEAEEKKALKEAKKKALEEEKARKEELAKAALQEKAAREEAAKQSQEEKKKQAVSVKEIKEPVINEDEIQIALLQEKLAAKESAKKAKEEERLRKEELKRIEAEERKAREEAKKKALEEEKARKEELAKAALQEKLALKEAEKKAKEEERLRKEESKRTEAEEKLAAKESAKKAKEEERLRKEELKRIEAEERKAREEAKKKAL
ncbi:MAG: carboxypeptidase-like regulatory domain-containing protein, partial [Endomicrobiaceae bacterium]|nr:carboxypeptidase-like regulatory domain-containing protein [Endomicrobiaceae bacterium]